MLGAANVITHRGIVKSGRTEIRDMNRTWFLSTGNQNYHQMIDG